MRELDVFNLFPIPIGIAKLGRDMTKNEMEYIKSLDFYKNEGNLTSTEDNVLGGLPDIYDFCMETVSNYIRGVYRISNNSKIRITQSWVNVTNKQEHHHRHSHANSVFSASFYIQTTGDDKIYFFHPVTNPIDYEVEDYNIYNAKSWWVPANAGTIVIFPSWLQHEVKTKDHEGERISLAFNTFFHGEIGSRKEKTHLIL